MLTVEETSTRSRFRAVTTVRDPEQSPLKKAIRTVKVTNQQGLHLRPCMAIVNTAGKYRAEVMVRKGSQSVDAASILELLTLAASPGSELVLSASGAESQQAVEAVAGLFASGFQDC